LLADQGLEVELAIVESGIPPEFRAWITNDGVAVAPARVNLQVTLRRLDGTEDIHNFAPKEDYLQGDAVVYEPHSFEVSVVARLDGASHEWHYENFEGRTTIASDMAEAMGIETRIASGATLSQLIAAQGRITLPPEGRREIHARYPGIVRQVFVSAGDSVKQGERLFEIESDTNLRTYTVSAPADGVLTGRLAQPGEHSASLPAPLAVLVNTRVVWAELDIFPSMIERVAESQQVALRRAGRNSGAVVTSAVVDFLSPELSPDQRRVARVTIDNREGQWTPGEWLRSEIEVGRFDVPLAVKQAGLQTFRDFTVVYEKVGEQYEVRMLDLGRGDGEWVEVLGGLRPGAEYVTTNSFVLKADIEKSGASHDH
jgi:cobalt-zinc-cadmium efflux system membrane fusion protein